MTTAPETTTTCPFRLIVRSEGQIINAYLAKDADLSETIWIGGISAAVAQNDEAIYQQWQVLMRAVVVHLFNVIGLTPVSFEEVPVPERGGTA